MNGFTWYLVSLITGAFVGPMPIQSCVQAEKLTQNYGIVCRQADYFLLCPVPGRPEAYTSCPQFVLPQVTVKEPSQ